MKVALLLVASLLAVNAVPEGVQVEQDTSVNFRAHGRANMNDYFDSVLEQAKIFMLENDMVPYALPDSINGFCVRWLFVNYHGELYLTNGWLSDLTTISRRGDSELFYGEGVMNIKAVIGFDFLQMQYDYLAKVMGIGPTGGIIGTIKDVTWNVDIVVNLLTGEAHVDSLKVLSTGSLDLKFTGTILMDIILNAVSDIVTWMFKDLIMTVVTLVIKIAINAALASIGGPPPTSPPLELF